MHHKKTSPMARKMSVLGIDIVKLVFHVVGMDNTGTVVLRQRLARVLMLKGAELILTPNACMLEPNQIGQFRARAFENMVGVAMANYAAPQANGHSVAFDGIAFDAHGSRETCLVEAGEEAGVYLAAFDMTQLRAWREHEVWGNAYRKLRAYQLLTVPAIAPPFVRADARR